jgi:hypothetical protein
LPGHDLGHVVLGVALAVAHAHFGRLLRDRLVGEDADEDAATALDVARDGAAGRFDLARRDAAALGGLEAEFAERHVGAARGDAGVAALLFLAELATCGLQHRYSPLVSPPPGPAARRTRLTAGLGPVASGAVGGAIGAGHLRVRGATVARGRPRPAPGATGTRATTRTAIVFAFGLGQRRRLAVGQAVTAVDPDLDADDAVGGLGFREAVVDVGRRV